MGKSLEEVMRKMQLEHEQRVNERKAEEEKATALYERQRRQWQERNRMYEAIAPAAASSAAAGAGGNNTMTNFLVFQPELGLGRLKKDGTMMNVPNQFTGLVTLSNCAADPAFIYYVAYDAGGVTFGKMSKSNFQRIDIDTTNLRALTSLNPASLSWDGTRFIYMDNPFYSSNSEYPCGVYSITLAGEVESLGNIPESVGFYPEVLFTKDGNAYTTGSYFFGSPFSGLLSVDLDTLDLGLIEFFYMIPESLPNGIVSTKVTFVVDVEATSGKTYGLVVFNDKDNGGQPYECVAEINLEDGSIRYINNVQVLFGALSFAIL